ncbi:hypothetical protein LUTEI9C_70174 [Luteimonas sp. 9C]|nr:hypothetical protein LUTEI9C_70174 [Luteimonas sp. 9C]
MQPGRTQTLAGPDRRLEHAPEPTGAMTDPVRHDSTRPSNDMSRDARHTAAVHGPRNSR